MWKGRQPSLSRIYLITLQWHVTFSCVVIHHITTIYFNVFIYSVFTFTIRSATNQFIIES